MANLGGSKNNLQYRKRYYLFIYKFRGDNGRFYSDMSNNELTYV